MKDLPVDTTLYSLSDAVPLPDERRGGERHLTLFRVGSIVIGECRELCLIKNISAGGMLIRAYSALQPGTAVAVELKRGEAVAGRVGWVSGGNAGITFDQPIDVVGMLASSMEGPRPRMPRVEVRCIASVRQDGNVFGMRTRDVSQGGIKVESDRVLALGAGVIVGLPGLGAQPGTVRWREEGCYGITFNRLLALPDLVRWLSDQRQLLRATG